MEKNIQENERYFLAQKRVKSIRGFYIHLFFYVVVNSIIIVQIYLRSESGFLRWHNFSMLLFWGIGLLAHAIRVFGSNLIFGKEWEKRKIQELMEKEKKQKWE